MIKPEAIAKIKNEIHPLVAQALEAMGWPSAFVFSKLVDEMLKIEVVAKSGMTRKHVIERVSRMLDVQSIYVWYRRCRVSGRLETVFRDPRTSSPQSVRRIIGQS